jgi:predicted O-methyltransferase YrrM
MTGAGTSNSAPQERQRPAGTVQAALWSLAGQAWRLRFFARRPSRQELRNFVLSRMPPGGVCAEIGVSKGNFSASILAAARPRRLYLIDPWISRPELEQSVRARFAAEIRAGTVEVIHETSEAASERFADCSLDWLYIDGNHNYEFVRKDLELYYPKVKSGGYIVCDDYHYAGRWNDGVTRAVDEFMTTGRCQRIFKRRSQFVMRKR